ncbi:HlyD family efflux transporter periplasmic adaptor subunit [Streptomyces sp. NPDC093094]|uniref:HlyD family efflux transporter periplasmic adaptor subunit n=1 Tax=Streptomyces sp. NPDC093094 TaxID=3366026 RepID=UPI0038048BF8
MQFRQQALSRLRSPDDLDLPVRLARPQGRLVLFVTLAATAAAAVWAVTGSVSSTVSAPAVLTHGRGSYVLQSPVAGQVTAVLTGQGEQLGAGAPVLKVRTAEGESVVRAVAAGRVTALAASVGQIVPTGADIAAVEKVTDADAPLYATVYVPAREAASVPAGAAVDLALQTVPARQYGVLRGHVASVDRSPQSAREIGVFLGDARLGEQFTREGRPVAVLVRLDRAPGTRSGYRWSTSDGPPHRLASMTLADGSIRLADRRPVDWLLP